MQRIFGQRIGHEIICASAQQLMQQNRRQGFGDQQDTDGFRGRPFDDHADQVGLRFVVIIQRDGQQFQIGRFRVIQKRDRFDKPQLAPGFGKFCFHVLDQQIEVLHVSTNRAGLDHGFVIVATRHLAFLNTCSTQLFVYWPSRTVQHIRHLQGRKIVYKSGKNWAKELKLFDQVIIIAAKLTIYDQ